VKSNTQYTTSHSIAVLAVGEPKTGKTRLLMSFPTPGIIDCGMNLNSAVRVSSGKEFYYTQPSLTDDNKEVPLEDRWLRCVSETKAMLADPRIRTICVDDLGVLCEWIIAHIIKQNRLAGTNKTGKMELRDYGDLARLLRDYVSMLRIGGKIVYVSSHQTADRDDLTGAMRYALAIPGQSKDTLGGLFTDVWATRATPAGGGKVKYEICTRPTGFHVALGTSFDLPAVIDVTDKDPAAVWQLLEPKLSFNLKPFSTSVETKKP